MIRRDERYEELERRGRVKVWTEEGGQSEMCSRVDATVEMCRKDGRAGTMVL